MKLTRLWIAILAMSLTSCYETKLDYEINPDGSGRVVVEVQSASMMSQLGHIGGKEAAGPGALAKDVLRKSSGIDTWKDIEIKTMDDGKSFFKGTAYFKDLRVVRFKEISMLDSVSLVQNKKTITVSIGGDENKARNTASKAPTKEELDQAIKEQKAGFQQMKPMLTAILGTMKTDISIRLPGQLQKSTNFKTGKQGRLSLSMEGQKMLDALERLMADDAFIRRQAQAGANIKDKPPMGDELREMLFGEKGPVMAEFKGPFKPLFDYESEASAARAGYDAMLVALGIDLSESVTGAALKAPVANYKGGDFKSVRIARMAYANMADPNYELFGDDRSYQATFIAELPGAIMAVEKVVLTTAIADNGEDLMPDEWNREVTWTDVSKDKTHVKWNFTLRQPSDAVKGLKTVAGTVFGQVAGSTKVIDTGIRRFETAAAGTEFGATVEEINESEYQHDIKIKFNVDDKTIREVQFFSADGQRLMPINYYSSSYDGTSSWSYSFEHTLPTDGVIKAEINDDVTFIQIPFQVTNVDLFGRPVK